MWGKRESKLYRYVFVMVLIEFKDPDEFLHMRRMIWICVSYACLKALFRLTRPISSKAVLKWMDIIYFIDMTRFITKTRLFKYIETFTSKNWKISDKKNLWYFLYQGGSNEYPQSMFWAKNKKNNVYPCKPQFYFIKVGFKGVKIIKACFHDWWRPGPSCSKHR